MELIICSECGEGHFGPLHPETDPAPWLGDAHARCDACSHTVYVPSDVAPYLDAGESLVWDAARLSYVTLEG